MSALTLALVQVMAFVPPAHGMAPVELGSILTRVMSEQKPTRLNLSKTVDAAILNSAYVQIARRQLQLDSVKISEAGAPLQPSIALSGSETRFDRPTTISFGTLDVTALHDHLEILQAQLTQTVDLLGHVRDARSAARLQQAADFASYDSVKLNKALEAKIKYLNVLRATHQVDVSQTALRQAQDQEAIAKRLYEGQVGQKVDYLRAQSNTAEAVQNYTAAKNNADVAKAAFNDVIARPLDTPVELEDVPGISVGADIEMANRVGSDPKAANPKFNFFEAPLDLITKTPIEKVIADAQVRRPEILRSTALVRASEVGIRIAHESIEPSFTVTLTGDKYPTTSLSYPRNGVASLTVAATFPIFDGGVARDEVQQARQRLEQDKLRLSSTQSDIALEVKSDYLNLVTAAKQLSAANANLLTAIAARQLAEVRFSSQVGLFIEISDAQAALVRAETAQVDAIYTYFGALATYENALGLPIASQTNSLDGLSVTFPRAEVSPERAAAVLPDRLSARAH